MASLPSASGRGHDVFWEMLVYDHSKKESKLYKGRFLTDPSTLSFEKFKEKITSVVGYAQAWLFAKDKTPISSNNWKEISQRIREVHVSTSPSLNLRDTVNVNFQPHHDTLTLGGRNVYHDTENNRAHTAAIAEFVDNSLAATKRNAGARTITISMHEYTDAPEKNHMIILDNGKGMDIGDLQAWATLNYSHDRRAAARGGQSLEETSAAGRATQGEQMDKSTTNGAHYVNGNIGHFGLGGKSAAFFFADRCHVITSPRSNPDKIHELAIDSDEMEKRAMQGEDVYSAKATTRLRGEALNPSVDYGEYQRLYGKYEKEKRSFTALILMGMKDEHFADMLKDKLWIDDLAHIYHYYLHDNDEPLGSGTETGRSGKGKAKRRSGAAQTEPANKIAIEVVTYVHNSTTAAPSKTLHSLGKIPDLESRFRNKIHKTSEDFHFQISVTYDAGGSEYRLPVYGTIRYHPFRIDRELKPVRAPSAIAVEGDDFEGFVDDWDVAQENKALPLDVFKCFWNGRLIPDADIESLSFCNPYDRDGHVLKHAVKSTISSDMRHYGRLSGILSFGGTGWKVTTNKCSFTSDVKAVLNDESQCVYKLRLANGTYTGQSLGELRKKFNEYLQRQLQHDSVIEFVGVQNTLQSVTLLDNKRQLRLPKSNPGEAGLVATAYTKATAFGYDVVVGEGVRPVYARYTPSTNRPHELWRVTHLLRLGDHRLTSSGKSSISLFRYERQPASIYEESGYMHILDLFEAKRNNCNFLDILTPAEYAAMAQAEAAKLPSTMHFLFPAEGEFNSTVKKSDFDLNTKELSLRSQLGPFAIDLLRGHQKVTEKYIHKLIGIAYFVQVTEPQGDRRILFYDCSGVNRTEKEFCFWFKENTLNVVGAYTLRVFMVNKKLFDEKIFRSTASAEIRETIKFSAECTESSQKGEGCIVDAQTFHFKINPGAFSKLDLGWPNVDDPHPTLQCGDTFVVSLRLLDDDNNSIRCAPRTKFDITLAGGGERYGTETVSISPQKDDDNVHVCAKVVAKGGERPDTYDATVEKSAKLTVTVKQSGVEVRTKAQRVKIIPGAPHTLKMVDEQGGTDITIESTSQQMPRVCVLDKFKQLAHSDESTYRVSIKVPKSETTLKFDRNGYCTKNFDWREVKKTEFEMTLRLMSPDLNGIWRNGDNEAIMHKQRIRLGQGSCPMSVQLVDFKKQPVSTVTCSVEDSMHGFKLLGADSKGSLDSGRYYIVLRDAQNQLLTQKHIEEWVESVSLDLGIRTTEIKLSQVLKKLRKKDKFASVDALALPSLLPEQLQVVESGTKAISVEISHREPRLCKFQLKVRAGRPVALKMQLPDSFVSGERVPVSRGIRFWLIDKFENTCAEMVTKELLTSLNQQTPLFQSTQIEHEGDIKFKVEKDGSAVAYNFCATGKVNQQFKVAMKLPVAGTIWETSQTSFVTSGDPAKARLWIDGARATANAELIAGQEYTIDIEILDQNNQCCITAEGHTAKLISEDKTVKICRAGTKHSALPAEKVQKYDEECDLKVKLPFCAARMGRAHFIAPVSYQNEPRTLHVKLQLNAQTVLVPLDHSIQVCPDVFQPSAVHICLRNDPVLEELTQSEEAPSIPVKRLNECGDVKVVTGTGLPDVVFVVSNVHGNIIKASALGTDLEMTVVHHLKGKRGQWSCTADSVYFTVCATAKQPWIASGLGTGTSTLNVAAKSCTSGKLEFTVVAGPPARLLYRDGSGQNGLRAAVSNTTPGTEFGRNFDIVLADQDGNIVSNHELSGAAIEVHITAAASGGAGATMTIPRLDTLRADMEATMALTDGVLRFDVLRLEQNCPGANNCDYDLVFSTSNASIAPFRHTFRFTNDTLMQQNINRVATQRRTLRTEIASIEQRIRELTAPYRDAQRRFEAMVAELDARKKEVRAQRSMLNQDFRGCVPDADRGLDDVRSVRGALDAVRARQAVLDQNTNAGRRVMPPHPREQHVIGRLGNLIKVQDDTVMNILCWVLGRRIDLLVVANSATAERKKRSAVLALDMARPSRHPHANKQRPWPLSANMRKCGADYLVNHIECDREALIVLGAYGIDGTLFFPSVKDMRQYRKLERNNTGVLYCSTEKIESSGTMGGSSNFMPDPRSFKYTFARSMQIASSDRIVTALDKLLGTLEAFNEAKQVHDTAAKIKESREFLDLVASKEKHQTESAQVEQEYLSLQQRGREGTGSSGYATSSDTRDYMRTKRKATNHGPHGDDRTKRGRR
eukprot:m.1635708 g.1635708  ORF g.1635708 m.1635708 type:complete len:2231 (+) comp25422_c0_seq7:162-6854(+)